MSIQRVELRGFTRIEQHTPKYTALGIVRVAIPAGGVLFVTRFDHPAVVEADEDGGFVLLAGVKRLHEGNGLRLVLPETLILDPKHKVPSEVEEAVRPTADARWEMYNLVEGYLAAEKIPPQQMLNRGRNVHSAH